MSFSIQNGIKSWKQFTIIFTKSLNKIVKGTCSLYYIFHEILNRKFILSLNAKVHLLERKGVLRDPKWNWDENNLIFKISKQDSKRGTCSLNILWDFTGK